MTDPRSLRSLVLVPAAALVALAMVLAGCANKAEQYDPSVAVEGEPVAASTVLTIDVQNDAGSVTIVASKRVKAPEITARLRSEVGSRFDVPEQHSVSATLTQGDSPTLRVTNLPEGAPAGLLTDIRIVVPRIGGVSVRNGGGSVSITGATGRVDVDNGFSNGRGGEIELRFAEPLTNEVRATTPRGGILAVAPKGSKGVLDLQSDDGQAGLYAASEHVNDVRSQRSRVTGVLNGGENAISLRSGRGRARLVINSKPISLVDVP
ncbi:MAG: hypothetical protein RBS39_11650 [Phycisphaerales bacterium]|jgi:hypothetical protein|nr:hypothetical protein [Phycisphaerales bacterium]